MKKLLIKFACLFAPNFLLRFFLKHKYTKQHHYPTAILVHRRKAKVIYEIEFNWYDNDLLPVSLVREVISGKRFSISYYEMYEFKEFAGSDYTIGNSIGNYGKEE